MTTTQTAQTVPIDPTTGRPYRTNDSPAMRPDLAPGQTVTHKPDRWCEHCSQARGTRLCPICGAHTVVESDLQLSAIDRVPVSFSRPMGAIPRDLGELEGPEPLEEADASAQLIEAGHALADATLEEAEPLEEQPEHPPSRGARTQQPPREQRTYVRQTEESEPTQRRKRIVDVEPRAPITRNPYPIRDTRKKGAAAMQTHVTPPRGSVQRAAPPREFDESGREVHRTGAARRARSLDDVYQLLWDDAKVDKATWVAFACAAMQRQDDQGPLDPASAAAFADEMYKEILLREQK